GACGGAEKSDSQQEKPKSAVERRPHIEGNLPSGFVPSAIVVCSLHTETIVPGRQVGVVSNATRAGIRPLLVEALKDIAIPELCRINIAESNILKGEAVVTGRDILFGCEKRKLDIVDGESFYDDWRSEEIFAETSRVSDAAALACREPEKPLCGLPSGWVADRGCLFGRHAVGAAIRDGVGIAVWRRRTSDEASFGGTRDAAGRA